MAKTNNQTKYLINQDDVADILADLIIVFGALGRDKDEKHLELASLVSKISIKLRSCLTKFKE